MAGETLHLVYKLKILMLFIRNHMDMDSVDVFVEKMRWKDLS